MLFGAVVFLQCFLKTRFRVADACILVIPLEGALSVCLMSLYFINASEGTLLSCRCLRSGDPF